MRVRSSSRAMILPVLLGAFVVGCESATDPVTAGFATSPALVDAGYTLQDIGTLGGAFSNAFDVSDDGVVVGRSQTASGAVHAFAFADGALQDLGSPGAGSSEAWLIGDGGHIAGIFRDGGDTRTAVWADGGVSVIDGFGGSFTAPTGVGPSGTVVGWSRTADATASRRAFLWSAGVTTDLGTLGGLESAALAINGTGDAVGWAHDASGDFHAVVWPAAGGIQDLGTLGGLLSEALAINDAGVVAGTAQTASGDMHAFLWSAGGGMIDLTPGLSGQAEAIALNEAGQAAVRVMATSDQAFLWDGTQLLDLATLGGTFSDVMDLDGAGAAAGVSETAEGVFAAAVWPGVEPAPLPLGGADAGAAVAANSGGTVVGNLRFGSVLHAAVWTPSGGGGGEGGGGGQDGGGEDGSGGDGETGDPIQALIDAVHALADGGALSHGPTQALLVSLENARDMRDAGRTAKALIQLRVFSHKVQAMVRGDAIDAADASDLFGLYVDAVESLRDA